ncbi:MAG: ATP-dependent sacrificial sulfur transferase LarE [Planctomycetota bacterium]|nr:ATP-dependent sacrificial sulfur transferase LarE [Planctomycetota bacterium]
MTQCAEDWRALRSHIQSTGSSAIVAFSGGVDSTLVLKAAQEVLGDQIVAVTGLSPSLSPTEARKASDVAGALGCRIRHAYTQEMENPAYVANGDDRCYHCKTELYFHCQRIAEDEGYESIFDGTNADDANDWRPGMTAAREAGVRSPLLETGLGKKQIRALAKELGLPNWDKPALPCLASRLPHGTSVTTERLAAVDHVESWLRSAGFRDVRARHFGEVVRIEVDSESIPRLLELTQQTALQGVVQDAGFVRFEVDTDGFRSGKLTGAPTPPSQSPTKVSR